MNKYFLIIVSLCFCLSAVAQTGGNDNAQKPKFIKDVVMHGHIRVSSNAIPEDKVVPDNTLNTNAEEKKITTVTPPPVASVCVDVAPAGLAATPQVLNAIIGKYAGMLGAEIEDIASHFSLYSFIEDWYGVNYRLGGKDKSGIDCSAFAQKLYEQVFGIDLLRTALDQFKNCKIIHDLSQAKEGDLVFFHINGSRITHVGIYLANNYFVHASSANGVVINNLKDKYYQKYLAGIGRLTHK